MKYYAGVDLHSNNSVVVVIDESDEVQYSKRLRNELPAVRDALFPFERDLAGVVVESTYNWYWLVDGLMDAGHRVHLANTTAIEQYSGLKYADDTSDARWLAHLLRLGILPEAHIYDRDQRPLRDLLRKRSQLVRLRTVNVLGAQNIVARNSGVRISGTGIKRQTDEDVDGLGFAEDVGIAIKCNLAVMHCIDEQVKLIEKRVEKQARTMRGYEGLLNVPGIGKILGMTILLEAGPMERFAAVGNFSSYARCVGSDRTSNGKRKGKGNTKNGNKYLGWAFIEAANFAIRYNEQIRRYYQRKASRTKRVVALKAIAHKLARACYYVLRDGVAFDVNRAFG
jgi:transposase